MFVLCGMQVVRLLLGAGANVDRPRSDSGATALFTAAQNGDAEVAAVLIAAGADVNKPLRVPIENASPLWIASSLGHVDVVRLLVLHNADPLLATRRVKNSTTTGSIPLDVARRRGHIEGMYDDSVCHFILL